MGSLREINLSLGLSATVDKSTRGKLLRDQSLFGASQLLLIRVLVGSFKEINLSLGLSATADKSTRGKLLRDQSLFGSLSYF